MSNKSAKDFSTEYLTFRALEDTTFALSTNDVYYSVDNGTTWTLLTTGTSTPTILAGHTIKWKGELTPATDVGVGKFSSTGRFDAEGNAYSLLYGDNFEDVTDISDKDYALYGLFAGCTGIIHARNMILQSLVVPQYGYRAMFDGCSSLVDAPELPAIIIKESTYFRMFANCTSLVKAPSTISALSIGGTGTCSRMFLNCRSLNKAPDISAISVKRYSFQEAFMGCTSLTQAPLLRFAKLSYRTCERMFADCSNLSYVNAQFVSLNDGTAAMYDWLKGTSATGTIVKSTYSTINDEYYYVPDGWTLVEANPNIANNLPQDYTQVEYIASTPTGGQWIDLNLQMWKDAPTTYALDMQVNLVAKGVDDSNMCVLLGANEEISPYYGFVIRKNRNSNNVEQNKNPVVSSYGNLNTMIWIGQTQANLNVGTHNVTTTLFAGLNDSLVPFRFSETRIYHCRIFDNSLKWVRDLVPCIRNSDNKVGLYDLANDVFYTNSGSGDDFVYNPLPNNNN